MGHSPMHRGPAARVGLADLDLGRGLVALDQAVRHLVDLADIRGRVGRVDLAGLVDLADIRDRAGRVAPAGLAGLDLVDPAGMKAPVGLADLDLAVPVVPVGLVDLHLVARRCMDPVGLAVLVDLARRADRRCMDPVAQADPVVRLDRQQRRTRPEVRSTGVARRWAVPGMCRTASARPTTVRRLHRYNTAGAGMAGLRPERRRLGGTDRRPRVAGAVRRLPVVGMAPGTVRRAI